MGGPDGALWFTESQGNKIARKEQRRFGKGGARGRKLQLEGSKDRELVYNRRKAGAKMEIPVQVTVVFGCS